MNSFPLSCFFWKFSNLQKCRDAHKLYLELGNQLLMFPESASHFLSVDADTVFQNDLIVVDI